MAPKNKKQQAALASAQHRQATNMPDQFADACQFFDEIMAMPINTTNRAEISRKIVRHLCRFITIKKNLNDLDYQTFVQSTHWSPNAAIFSLRGRCQLRWRTSNSGFAGQHPSVHHGQSSGHKRHQRWDPPQNVVHHQRRTPPRVHCPWVMPLAPHADHEWQGMAQPQAEWQVVEQDSSNLCAMGRPSPAALPENTWGTLRQRQRHLSPNSLL